MSKEQIRRKIAVIGGGPAGMMAAIQASMAGADTELYERNDRVGKKLLSTGNGKCNFSNKDMTKNAYYGSAVSLYDDLYTLFGMTETIDFFSQNGMRIHDRQGYLYPASNQASTVLDIMRFTLERYHVTVHTDSMIQTVSRGKNGSFQVALSDASGLTRAKKNYDALILACGGKAAPKTGSDGNGFALAEKFGHHITEVVPALVQLKCREEFLKSVAGVRTNAALTLYIDGVPVKYEQGELQLTDYGISGIPVFQFSREAAYALLHKKSVTVGIDLLPEYEQDEYTLFFKNRLKDLKDRTLEQFLTGMANKKINQLIIRLSGCKPQDIVSSLSAAKCREIAALYRNLTLTVYKTNGFEQAQVSAGGIPANELSVHLESKYVPHLYFAGEIVDMDGICGGYNLQWAWTSGAVAGRAAAGNLKDHGDSHDKDQ